MAHSGPSKLDGEGVWRRYNNVVSRILHSRTVGMGVEYRNILCVYNTRILMKEALFDTASPWYVLAQCIGNLLQDYRWLRVEWIR